MVGSTLSWRLHTLSKTNVQVSAGPATKRLNTSYEHSQEEIPLYIVCSFIKNIFYFSFYLHFFLKFYLWIHCVLITSSPYSQAPHMKSLSLFHVLFYNYLPIYLFIHIYIYIWSLISASLPDWVFSNLP